MKVRDWVEKVRKLDIIAALGHVPCLDFTVLMSGENGSAVIADIEAKRCGSHCRRQGPTVRGWRL